MIEEFWESCPEARKALHEQADDHASDETDERWSADDEDMRGSGQREGPEAIGRWRPLTTVLALRLQEDRDRVFREFQYPTAPLESLTE